MLCLIIVIRKIGIAENNLGGEILKRNRNIEENSQPKRKIELDKSIIGGGLKEKKLVL